MSEVSANFKSEASKQETNVAIITLLTISSSELTETISTVILMCPGLFLASRKYMYCRCLQYR